MPKQSQKAKVAKCKYDMVKWYFENLFEMCGSVSESSKEQFKVRCMVLEDKYNQFVELHAEICADVDDDDLSEGFKTYTNYYYEIKTKFMSLSGPVVSQASCDEGKKKRSLLPKIQIPTFSGKLEEYTSFSQLFESLIGNDAALTDVERMYYLMGCLAGEAKSLVQHLGISAENYSVALSLLKGRYLNKRLLADRLLHTMMKAQHVQRTLGSLKGFLNTLLETTKALEKLGFPIEEWSYLLFYINYNKMDSTLKDGFEDKYNLTGGSTNVQDVPSFADLVRFLEGELRKLETSGMSSSLSTTKTTTHQKAHTVTTTDCFLSNDTNQAAACSYCNNSHPLVKCFKFLDLKPQMRKQHAISEGLCFRCLNKHFIGDCTSGGACGKCSSTKHHVLLHFEVADQHQNSNAGYSGTRNNNAGYLGTRNNSNSASHSITDKRVRPSNNNAGSDDTANSNEKVVIQVERPVVQNSLHASQQQFSKKTVLLSTAIIEVMDSCSNYQTVRALLDSGSQGSFISESCVQQLGLKRFKSNVSEVRGISDAQASRPMGAVSIRMRPRNAENPVLSTTGTILMKITDNVPNSSLPPGVAEAYSSLPLADDRFFESCGIDVLIGADLLGDVIIPGGMVKVQEGLPYAMETIFGYVLIGPIRYKSDQIVSCATLSLNVAVSTDQLLEKLWEVEDFGSTVFPDPKDLECEQHFQATHQRDESGRYLVQLPLSRDPEHLGDSLSLATKRFLALERRLEHTNKGKYIEFMREYAEMKHMTPFEGDVNSGIYVIPHHGVFKSGTDKLRVVFDASCPTKSGVSMNDCLHAGPKLQKDIMAIICRFRLDPVVFTTDIRMMFRQIMVAEEHRKLQLILWREAPEQTLQLYQLNTVTYGMKSSPYLAIRTLQQLADDGETEYPAAASLLRTSVYMDDILGGASTEKEANELKADLISLLGSGGFELSKWVSNSPRLLSDIAEEHQERPHVFDKADETSFVKILGVQWNPVTDNFSYNIQLPSLEGCTKRAVLSTIARTFDPMGWISPVIFQGKVLMQKLWSLNLNWDETPPTEIVNEWTLILTDLAEAENVKIERLVLPNDVIHCSLHGFADASDLGYGAVVYLRTVDSSGRVYLSLMMAKSRVAPIKARLTIPKLELSGAALVIKVLNYVHDAVKDRLAVDEFVCWSDSTITLSWLRTPLHLLQIFEANRVSRILNCGLQVTWRHVPTNLNPADVASRGCRAAELLRHELWWRPEWLLAHEVSWPPNIVKAENDLPGLRKSVLCHAVSLASDMPIAVPLAVEVLQTSDTSVAVSPASVMPIAVPLAVEVSQASDASVAVSPASDMPITGPLAVEVTVTSDTSNADSQTSDKSIAVNAVTVTSDKSIAVTGTSDTSIFERYSSLDRLISVVAYCKRFINNCRKRNNPTTTKYSSVSERKQALDCLIRLVQKEEFSSDLESLRKNAPCSLKLRRLAPFIDDSGLLRMGGRLRNADLSFAEKHPVLLPKSHVFTRLVIDYYHKIYCHIGATVLQSILQSQYWIISARQVIRGRLYRCVHCLRSRAKPTEPIMADLPADRVNIAGVFETIQTDFAGPFYIKTSKLRNAKVMKAYLCVFVCSASKAVHLEVVGDMSTDGFIAALVRFVSRRGLPALIRSDCGSNYIGTNRHLNEVQKYLSAQGTQEDLANWASKRGINWIFNPPSAPHFGGLFEAAVKSAKTLLHKIVGITKLTFEELTTVFARVEAVLNSRPLCPLNVGDPDNFEVLTPAHLLIGRSLLAVPEYKLDSEKMTRLSRYQMTQAMGQHFWRQWSSQYLHTLQMRFKWTSLTDPPKVGDLVLIKDDNLPALSWKLGRIMRLLPGKDGVVRVVELKTAGSMLTRPVVKIVRLPLDD